MCEYVKREGSRDHSKRTAWTAGVVRFIDWRDLWWLCVRQCFELAQFHLETVYQTESKLLGTMPQTGDNHLETMPETERQSLGDSATPWHIHLQIEPQCGSHSLAYSASVKILVASYSSALRYWLEIEQDVFYSLYQFRPHSSYSWSFKLIIKLQFNNWLFLP
jgi:hypothetical protein